MIIYGYNSFAIRSFTLQDIGIHQNAAPELQLEIHQSYFHIFWIPVFGLGKRWVVRKNGKLYEMPDEIRAVAQTSFPDIKTPWYTYAAPILLVLGLTLFVVVKKSEQHGPRKNRSAEIRAQMAKETEEKLQHLTTKDFITVIDADQLPYIHFLYLKVEAIKGDEVTVTLVKSKSEEPMAIEKTYTKPDSTLPSVKISYKKLLAAFPVAEASTEAGPTYDQGVNLLNDNKSYLVREVIRHFGPIINQNGLNYKEGNRVQLGFSNCGWPVTLIDIKSVESNIDWSENVNKQFPTSTFGYLSTLSIYGKNYTKDQPYHFVMTFKDSTGQIYKYEVSGVDWKAICKLL